MAEKFKTKAEKSRPSPFQRIAKKVQLVLLKTHSAVASLARNSSHKIRQLQKKILSKIKDKHFVFRPTKKITKAGKVNSEKLIPLLERRLNINPLLTTKTTIFVTIHTNGAKYVDQYKIHVVRGEIKKAQKTPKKILYKGTQVDIAVKNNASDAHILAAIKRQCAVLSGQKNFKIPANIQFANGSTRLVYIYVTGRGKIFFYYPE